MKLSTYLIQEAVAAEDWKAIVSILAEHFNFAMPSEFRLDTYNDPYFSHPVHVEIRHGWAFYRWNQVDGFSSISTWDNSLTYAAIYLRK